MKKLPFIKNARYSFSYPMTFTYLILALLSACAQGPALLPQSLANLPPLTSEERAVRTAILEKLRNTHHWHTSLETIPVYSTDPDEVFLLCKGSRGCTDLASIVLEKANPAFCFSLVHELLHISQAALFGDPDQEHVDQTLFYAYPNNFCAEIPNPFFAAQDRCANGGFGCF